MCQGLRSLCTNLWPPAFARRLNPGERLNELHQIVEHDRDEVGDDMANRDLGFDKTIHFEIGIRQLALLV